MVTNELKNVVVQSKTNLNHIQLRYLHWIDCRGTFATKEWDTYCEL